MGARANDHSPLDCLRVSDDRKRPFWPGHGNYYPCINLNALNSGLRIGGRGRGRSSNRTIESSLLAKEAHLSFRIASHKADDDGLLLAALEPVDAAQLNAGICLLQRCEDRHLYGRGGFRPKLVNPHERGIIQCNNASQGSGVAVTCALYGVTTAMSSGLTPDSTRLLTCCLTSAASISLLLLSP